MATLAGLPPPGGVLKKLERGNSSGGQGQLLEIPSNIPLVNTLVTDDDLGFSSEANFDSFKLQTAVDLLTSQHSRLLKKRHFNILEKILSVYTHGFPLDSLVNVLSILNACADLVVDDIRYQEFMVALVTLLQKPFIKLQASDEISFKAIVTDSFAQLGYLLRVDSEAVRTAVVDTLFLLYSGTAKVVPAKEVRRVSFAFLSRAIEKSGVVETVMKALALFDKNQEILITRVFIFLKTASYSSLNCSHMLNAGAGYILCLSLKEHGNDYKQVQYTTEILWNLIEFGDRDSILGQLSNLRCLQILNQLLIWELSQSHSQYHRTIRNDVIAIVTQITEANPDGPLIESGFVKSVLLIFTCNETKSKNALVRHVKFHENSEDFEFKKLLLSLILCFVRNISSLNLFRETKLFETLTFYLKPIKNIESNFNTSQLEEIQLQCLSALCILSSKCQELTEEPTYVTTVLTFFEWCINESDPYLSQGNSFFSSGGRNSKKSQLRYALRYIRHLTRSKHDEVVMMLVNFELVLKLSLLADDLFHELENPVEDLNPVTDKEDEREALCLDLLCECFYILGMFCQDFIDHKELVPSKTVSLFVKILGIDVENVCRGLGYNKLMLATVEAVWSCLVGSRRNEILFLENSGIFSLLNILEHVPRYLQSVILATILDFMENPLTIPHVLIWENKKQMKVAKILIQIWKSIELDIQVPRSENGVILNPTQPLKSPFPEAPDSDDKVISSKSQSKAIAEVAENMRAKIHGFFLKLRQDEIDGLMPSDFVWVSIIERYFDLKSADVWNGKLFMFNQY